MIRSALADPTSDRLMMVDADDVYQALRAEPRSRDELLTSRLAQPIRALVDRCGHVFAHGELVDVFCRSGDHRGAIALERWWNHQLETLPIPSSTAATRSNRSPTSRASRGSARSARSTAARPRRTPRSTSSGTQLVLLQRVTSALSEAATYDDVGRVVTGVLASAIGATRCALVVEGELIAVRGVTTPDDPEQLAETLDSLAGSWTRRPPPEVAWLGDALTAVIPLDPGGRRRGTLVLGFRAHDQISPRRSACSFTISRASSRSRLIARARWNKRAANARVRRPRTRRRTQFIADARPRATQPAVADPDRDPADAAARARRARARERSTIERSGRAS